jgi:hypothetical protein
MANRLHQNLTATATVSGEIQRSPLFQINQHNVLHDPASARTIAAIVGAISPFPDAARAGTAALRRLEEPETKQIEHVAAAD